MIHLWEKTRPDIRQSEKATAAKARHKPNQPAWPKPDFHRIAVSLNPHAINYCAIASTPVMRAAGREKSSISGSRVKSVAVLPAASVTDTRR